TPAWNEEPIANYHHGSLRRHSSERIGVMRLLHVDGAVAVVGPTDLTRTGIEGVDENTHEGPDAGGDVDGAVGDDRGAARGPSRTQAPVAEALAVAGAAANLP